MTILGINVGQSSYNPYLKQQAAQQSPQTDTTSTARNARSDTVQISERAKQISQSNSSTAVIDNNNVPLEALSLPSWLGSYHPDTLELSTALNEGYFDFLGKLDKMNISRDEERALIKNYLDNDPVHQEMQSKERYRARYSDELSEYSNRLNSYFTEALKENGVESGLDYYKKVVLDNESSEQIHETVRERLAEDPRMMELMELFNIGL